MAAVSLAAGPLAATGEAAKSGPLGLAVILFFCVACYFLFKSMSKHLRKVRDEFPVDSDDDAPPPPAGRAAGASASDGRTDGTPEEPGTDGPEVEPPAAAATDTERPTATP